MVKLSDKQIEEFQEIYKNKFGKDISKQEAYEQGTRLIELIKLVFKRDEDSTPTVREDRTLNS